MKDVIISGGFNLYPADLEAALMTEPDVVEAAVIGVPSDRWGETPVGFVVLAGDDADAVRDRANARLGKTQRLSEVIAMDELPRLRDRQGAEARVAGAMDGLCHAKVMQP